ncbi:hypothetical protein PsYK624_029280 [Phanerochaete sordida]|uniref:Uncharacterized protein n=1 Tax=Phanerochaete sordida TaxID=48140 RepID=A0A9P3L974_9APHY|nr:hypothetical protein PsYK624_029280 [Phanerochaete sordida]
MVLVLTHSLAFFTPGAYASASRTPSSGRRGSNAEYYLAPDLSSDTDEHSSIARRSARVRSASTTSDPRTTTPDIRGRTSQRESHLHHPCDRHAATARTHARPAPPRIVPSPPRNYRLEPPRLTLPPLMECSTLSEVSLLYDAGSMASLEDLNDSREPSPERPCLHQQNVTYVGEVGQHPPTSPTSPTITTSEGWAAYVRSLANLAQVAQHRQHHHQRSAQHL